VVCLIFTTSLERQERVGNMAGQNLLLERQLTVLVFYSLLKVDLVLEKV